MTARAQSLLERGVLRSSRSTAESLLDRDNIDPDALASYASDAANFATQYKLPRLEMAKNGRGNPDVSIFDFTSRYHAKSGMRNIWSWYLLLTYHMYHM